MPRKSNPASVLTPLQPMSPGQRYQTSRKTMALAKRIQEDPIILLQSGTKTGARRRNRRKVKSVAPSYKGVEVPVSFGTDVSSTPAIRQIACRPIGNDTGFGIATSGLSNLVSVTTTAGAMTFDQFVYAPINPDTSWASSVAQGVTSVGGKIAGPNGDSIIKNFRYFYPEEIIVDWMPTAPTSVSGSVAIACVDSLNAVAPNPTDITQLMDAPLSRMCPIWQPFRLKWRLGRTPNNVRDLFHTDINAINDLTPAVVVGFSGIVSGSTTSAPAGRLRMSIRWCLYGPMVVGVV